MTATIGSAYIVTDATEYGPEIPDPPPPPPPPPPTSKTGNVSGHKTQGGDTPIHTVVRAATRLISES